MVGGPRTRSGRLFPRVVCGLLLAAAAPAASQEVSVRAYLASNPVSPNRPFDLHVEIVDKEELHAKDLQLTTIVTFHVRDVRR